MKKGDLCFFYHSNIGKEIVGIVEVIKEAYLDKTDKSGRFVAVTVKFLEKLSKPISLESIKKTKELSNLALIKQSRLSVMPIDSKSWKKLINMLINFFQLLESIGITESLLCLIRAKLLNSFVFLMLSRLIGLDNFSKNFTVTATNRPDLSVLSR